MKVLVIGFLDGSAFEVGTYIWCRVSSTGGDGMSLLFWPKGQLFPMGNKLWRTTLEQTETESLTLGDSGFVPYEIWFFHSREPRNPESRQQVESHGWLKGDLPGSSVNR